jgi:adenylosuccinate lyase
MLENLYLHKALIGSEWLLFRLSGRTGKMKSLEKLHELSNKARDAGISFKDAVMDDPEIGSVLTREDMAYLDHPEKYIGHALQIVDETIEEIEKKRDSDSENIYE